MRFFRSGKKFLNGGTGITIFSCIFLLFLGGISILAFPGTSPAQGGAAENDPDKPRQKSKVLIGVIDKGMDRTSRCFYEKNNRSRVVSYLDQTGSSGKEIKRGHGWGMAAAAAGSLKIIDGSRVPLEIETLHNPVVLVNTTGKEDQVLEAVKYIITAAKKLDTRCVINFSYSKHFGPHSGSEPFVKAIDALLDDSALMVVPVGNDGQKGIYAEQKFAANGSAVLEFTLKNHVSNPAGSLSGKMRLRIELWFKKDLRVTAGLVSPSDTVVHRPHKSDYELVSGKEGNILITASPPDGSAYRGISIYLTNNKEKFPPPGKWRIKLFSRRGRPGLVKAWITTAVLCEARFSGAPLQTVSTLSLSEKVISVGSYVIEDDRLCSAPFSNSYKIKEKIFEPDVLLNDQVGVFLPEVNGPISLMGTSVSAALLTRLIAVLWEKYPQLSARWLREGLKGTAVNLTGRKYRWQGASDFRVRSWQDLLDLFSAVPSY